MLCRRTQCSVALAGLFLASLVSATDSSSDYIKVDGLRLVDSSNSSYFVSGFNYYACLNLAANESVGGNQSRFETEMQQMRDLGVNTLRIMAASEGAPTIQPNRMIPQLMPSPYNWDESMFVGLDRCLDKMSQYGIRAIMTLSNTWNWSGGFGQYVSWINGNESIPYPPSWDPYLNSPYGDYTTNGTWQGYIDYAIQFYNSTEAQDIYQAHIAKVVSRTNTVNGRKYASDPTILAWEPANEPQDSPLLNSWMNTTAYYIKSLGIKQLITSGIEGKQGEAFWKGANGSPAVDFASAHWWVQNQGIYNATDDSEGNLQTAQSSVVEYLNNVSAWTVDLNKPAILEEFGMARDEWQSVALGAPNNSYLYNASQTTSNRDAYFSTIIDTVSSLYNDSSKGIVGFMPWTYGGVWRPTDARNKYNWLLAGDPPHEAPGWYDTYDSDNKTLAILKKGFAIAK